MSWLQKLSSGLQGFIKNFGDAGYKGAAIILSASAGWGTNGRTASHSKLMEQYRGWVFKCISKIAEEIGALNLRLYRKTGSGDRRDWEPIEEHELLDILDAPNKSIMRFELFQLWSMHDDLVGNCYWLLEGVKGPEDKPVGIVVLNPRSITVKIDSNGSAIEYYEQEVNGKITRFQPYEIIHFRRPNPSNIFLGIGPTEAALDSIDALNWAQDWNKRFFQNGAMPGLILETEQTDETMIKLLRETFEDRFQGQDKAHKTAVLPRGVKIADKGNLSQKDMDFSELLVKMRDAILAAFGVPAVILGLGLGETINRASAETLEYVFALHTIKPKMRRFVMFLNAFLVSRYEDDLVLDFDDPVPANEELKIKKFESALGSNKPGYLTVNEIREELGFEPAENGDVLYGPVFIGPLGAPPEELLPAKDLGLRSLGGIRTGIQPKNKSSINAKKIKQIMSFQMRKKKPRKTLVNDLSEKIVETIKAERVRQVKELTTEDWEPRWDALVKRASTYESEIKKAMAIYAAGMVDRAEANIAEAEKAVIDVDKLLDRENEVAAVITGLNPIFQDILEKEGISAAEMVGVAFDATEERIQESLAKGLKLMADKYTDETINLIEGAFQAAYDEDDASLPALKKRLREIGEISASTRAETVAKTESFRMANFSTRAAWRQSGVVKTLKWYTAKDEMVCPFCAPQDGETVGIDDNFFDKGDTVEGEQNGEAVSLDLDYADVENPPLHPNAVFAGTSFAAYGDLEEMVGADYEGPAVLIKTSKGNDLTIGPNHPILTTRGLVRARDLTIGDDLVYDSRADNSALIKSNLDQMPLVEDAFHSILSSGGLAKVATARHDLHGDRVFCKGEIQVIEPTNRLLAVLDPCGIKEFREGDFMRPDVKPVGPSSDSSGRLDGDTIDLAAPSGVGRALPCSYEFVHIQSIHYATFIGKAFDATTESGLYNSNGFVVSNCRCYIRPEKIEI